MQRIFENSKHITFAIEKELRDKLKAEAKSRCIGLSEFMRLIIDDYFNYDDCEKLVSERKINPKIKEIFEDHLKKDRVICMNELDELLDIPISYTKIPKISKKEQKK
jgi:predicted protein tyrosine phosphatase